MGEPRSTPRGLAPPRLRTGRIEGELRAPGSKSIAQRLLVAAGFGGGITVFPSLPPGGDVEAALGAIGMVEGVVRSLASHPGILLVSGQRPSIWLAGLQGRPVRVGESGTLARLMTAMIALGGPAGDEVRIEGAGTLSSRTSLPLFEALWSVGVVTSHGRLHGGWPVRIRPAACPHAIELHHPVSSQEVSALLLALAPHGPDPRELRVRGAIPSLPYVRMTVALLNRFGVKVVALDDAGGKPTFTLHGMLFHGPEDAIEADASLAAVALAAACLTGGTLRVPGIPPASIQGDAAIVDHLEAFGCIAARDPGGLFAGEPPRRGATIDCSFTPDLAPPLAVVGAAAALSSGEPTVLTGLETLPRKESDRISVLAEGLMRAGFPAEAARDRIAVCAPDRPLDDAPVLLDPHGDHRMAFAFALLGLVRHGVFVTDPDCVAKSWPGFWEDMRGLGAEVVEYPGDIGG